MLIKAQHSILKRDNLLIDKLQYRIEYLECLLNKIDTDSFYPKAIKETHRTLGTHEFEVSDKITLKEITQMLNLNFKNHFDVVMYSSFYPNTIMVKISFDSTLYNERSFNAFKSIKEYLKQYKRY